MTPQGQRDSLVPNEGQRSSIRSVGVEGTVPLLHLLFFSAFLKKFSGLAAICLFGSVIA